MVGSQGEGRACHQIRRRCSDLVGCDELSAARSVLGVAADVGGAEGDRDEGEKNDRGCFSVGCRQIRREQRRIPSSRWRQSELDRDRRDRYRHACARLCSQRRLASARALPPRSTTVPSWSARQLRTAPNLCNARLIGLPIDSVVCRPRPWTAWRRSCETPSLNPHLLLLVSASACKSPPTNPCRVWE